LTASVINLTFKIAAAGLAFNTDLLSHTTQPVSRNNVTKHHAEKQRIVIGNKNKRKHNGKRTRCKRRLSLCHI